VGLLSVLIAAPVVARWRYDRDVERITDVVTQSVIANEDRGRGSLTISCINFPGGAVDYSFSANLGDMVVHEEGGLAGAFTRIDKAEPVKHKWIALKNLQTVYSQGPQKALFERMKQGKQFVI
jgi:hypothetical protein